MTAIAGDLIIGDGANAAAVRWLTGNHLSGSSAVTVNDLCVMDLNGQGDTVGSLAGASGASVLLGNGSLGSVGNNASTVYARMLSGSANSPFNQQGSGTPTLSG